MHEKGGERSRSSAPVPIGTPYGTREIRFRHSGSPPQLRHRTLTAQRPGSYSSAPSKSLGSTRRPVPCWPLLAHARVGPGSRIIASHPNRSGPTGALMSPSCTFVLGQTTSSTSWAVTPARRRIQGRGVADRRALKADRRELWPTASLMTSSESQESASDLRREWDLNPRGACTPKAFQEPRIRPLCHPSMLQPPRY